MIKYTGPKLKLIRKFGPLVGLTRKSIKNRIKTPGQHGKIISKKNRRLSIGDDFGQRLFEKQKLRLNYGLSEKKLILYYRQLKKQKNYKPNSFTSLLERRLDCLVYRLGFAATIPGARQVVNHGHIRVNNNLVNIPSFICSPGDIISIKDKAISKNLILQNYESLKNKNEFLLRRVTNSNLLSIAQSKSFSDHLKFFPEFFSGKFLAPVKKKNFLIRVNERKIVEYYSR